MTTYYFDATGGADGNTGLTPAQAWQTLTKCFNEFNAGTFVGGDSILFKCGESWTATATARLRIRNVGATEGNELYIGKYDEGPRPEFDGNSGAFAGYIIGSGLSDTAEPWVIIEDLKLTGVDAQCIGLDNGVHDWVMRNLVIGRLGDSYGNCIIIRRSYNILLEDCDLTTDSTATARSALYMGTAATVADDPHDILVNNCFIHDADNAAAATEECIDLKEGCYDIEIKSSTFKRAPYSECLSLRGNGQEVTNCIISNPAGRFGISAWFASSRGNEHVIKNNVLFDINGVGGHGLVLEGGSHDVQYNTFDNLGGQCVRLFGAGAASTVKNNIYHNADYGMFLSAAKTLPDSDLNCFRTMATNDLNLEAPRGGSQTIAAACAAHGIECNSVTSDPALITDFLTPPWGNANAVRGYKAPKFYNAVWFDGVNDYYQVADAASLTLQNGDWCVGIWLWVNDNSGSFFQYVLSNNNAGANNSFNLFLREDSVGGADEGRWECRQVDGGGTNLLLTADHRTMDDARWRLVVVQRNTAESRIEMWMATENANPIMEDSISDAGFAAVDGSTWNIARRFDGDVNRYYKGACCQVFKGDFVFSESEITEMARGLPALTAANKGGNSLDLYLEMVDATATIQDLSGNGNTATRNGGPIRALDNPEVCVPMRRRRQ